MSSKYILVNHKLFIKSSIRCLPFLLLIVFSYFTIVFLNSTSSSQHSNMINSVPGKLRGRKTFEETEDHPYLSNPNHWKFHGFIISNQNMCSTERHFDVLVLVISAPRHIDRRNCLRKYTPSNYQNVFMFGKGDDNIQRAISRESLENGDIVQGDFIDSHRNLTYKTLMAFTWAALYCPSARYIIKCDDDVMLNYDLIIRYLSSRAHSSELPSSILDWSILGYQGYTPTSSLIPLSDEESARNNISYNVGSGFYYVWGFAYITTMNVIMELLKHVLQAPYILQEDAYLTGLIRRHSGIIGIRNYSKMIIRSNMKEILQRLTDPSRGPYPYLISLVDWKNVCNLIAAYDECSSSKNSWCLYDNQSFADVIREPFPETIIVP